MLLALLPATQALAAPALPVVDREDEIPLYEVWNLLSATAAGGLGAGGGLGASSDLGAWAGPDGSGIFDGQVWKGGTSSVAIAISKNSASENHFGIYRDVTTGADKLTLHDGGGLAGASLLGSVFGAAFLFESESAVQDVGFWIRSQPNKGKALTFHGNSELDRRSTFGHLSSYHFGDSLTLSTDQGTLEVRNAHLLAWEDYRDADYNDIVLLVGEVGGIPVPEPGSGLLIAAGLGLALLPARIRRHN
jgi:hypothetical protein